MFKYPLICLVTLVTRYNLDYEEGVMLGLWEVKLPNLYGGPDMATTFVGRGATQDEARNNLCKYISNGYLFIETFGGRAQQIGPYIVINCESEEQEYKRVGEIFLDQNNRLVILLDRSENGNN